MSKKNSTKNSIIKAIALLVAFILGLLAYQKLTSVTFTEKMTNLFDENSSSKSFSAQSKYSDVQRDSIISLLYGFWEYDENKNFPIKINDRLEITKTGYIWRCEKISGSLPDSSKLNIIHIYNGFLYPTSKSAIDKNSVSSVIRNLDQMWIYNNDTCKITKYYGIGSNSKSGNIIVNEMDVIVSDFKDEPVDFILDSTFILSDRGYKKQNKKTNAPFFPVKLIDIVYNFSSTDNIKNNHNYSVSKKQVTLKKGTKTDIDISKNRIPECGNCSSSADFIRKAIIESVEHIEKNSVDTTLILDLIKNYYTPFAMNLAVKYSFYEKTLKNVVAKITMTIMPDGSVKKVAINIKAKDIGIKMITQNMVKEIEKWKFPKVLNLKKEYKISYRDTLKNDF
jgi:hypothetical protein